MKERLVSRCLVCGGRGRSGWAVLAVGALAASSLSVGVGPTGAAEGAADNPAVYSSCVGDDATADRGFADVVAGSTHSDAINCLAYYGVSIGSGDGSTFTPRANVTRRQMALFLARAAVPAGVALGAAADQGFSDVTGLPPAEQAAINRIAAAGIITGRTAASFGADALVTRADMALFLVRFLARAARFSDVTLADDGYTVRIAGVEPDSWFGDVRSGSPVPVDKAAGALYELGVTKGKNGLVGAQGVYAPGENVTRGEMASFITRALAHTNARPKGVSVQASKGNLRIAVRDGSFVPVAYARVDSFYVDTSKTATAFDSEGACDVYVVSSDTGLTTCEIDYADTIVSADGNIDVPAPPVSAGGTTLWTWTGSVGDTFATGTDWFSLNLTDQQSTTGGAEKVRVSYDHNGFYKDWYGVADDGSPVGSRDDITVGGDASTLTDTDDSTTAQSDDAVDGVEKLDVRYAPYDTEITVTLQLLDGGGTPTVGSSAGKWTVKVTEYIDFAAGSAVADPGDGANNGNSESAQIRERTIAVTADGSGRGAFTLTSPDPDARAVSCQNAQTDGSADPLSTRGAGCGTVYFEVHSAGAGTPKPITETASGRGFAAPAARNYEAADARDRDTLTHYYYENKPGGVNAYQGIVVFSDQPEDTAHKITLTGLVEYGIVGGTVSTTAALADYYGNPIKGQEIAFCSTATRRDDNGVAGDGPDGGDEEELFTSNVSTKGGVTGTSGQVVATHQLKPAPGAAPRGGALQKVVASTVRLTGDDADSTYQACGGRKPDIEIPSDVVYASADIVWAMAEEAEANVNATDSLDIVLSADANANRNFHPSLTDGTADNDVEFVAAGSVRDNQIITSTFDIDVYGDSTRDDDETHGDYTYVVYDPNDLFYIAYIDGADANRLGLIKPVSFEDFERELAEALGRTRDGIVLERAANAEFATSSGTNADRGGLDVLKRAALAWNNYSTTERDQVAVFRLYLPYAAPAS